MTFQHKPGQGSALKNDRKSKDSHPDFRGDICTPDGKVWEIAEWEGETRDGRPRRSYRLSEPREAQPNKFSRHEDEPIPTQRPSLRDDLDEPF